MRGRALHVAVAPGARAVAPAEQVPADERSVRGVDETLGPVARVDQSELKAGVAAGRDAVRAGTLDPGTVRQVVEQRDLPVDDRDGVLVAERGRRVLVGLQRVGGYGVLRGFASSPGSRAWPRRMLRDASVADRTHIAVANAHMNTAPVIGL